MRLYINKLFADSTERSSAVIFETLVKMIPMFLRGSWWRLWFKSSSGLALIGKHVAIRNPQYISVGSNFVVEDFSEIQGLSRQGIIFGDHVTIGRFAMIRPSGYYGREIGEGLQIGNNSNIGAYCYLGCSGRIQIGNNVLMGPRVSMSSENHNFSRLNIPIREQKVTRQPIVIQDNCWLGSSCVITAGVVIGEGSIIASGAVVTKDVPAYSVVGGVPAKLIKMRTSETDHIAEAATER